MEKVKIAAKGIKTVFCVDRNERGLTRVAASAARDLRDITDEKPCNIRVAGSADVSNGACANADVVIAVSIAGKGGSADNASDRALVEGKRECYVIRTEKEEKRTVIYILGSDQMGAQYGLLRISELAGVSPWHYFADVKNIKADSVIIDEEKLNCVSKEPAIKLRGFFMNDEWPSLGGWVFERFGGFNEFFYDHVFDLLLRLRGNFLWPAMWSAVFSEDGYAYPTAIAELANDLGIVMGTSHHEPLFRAGEEFSHTMTDSNESGYGKDWSYYSNERGLYSFWDDSVKRNRDLRSLITVGMRGERDSKILGEDATLGDNIALLKKTITDQKKILEENGLGDAPKVLALYKEVEDYFYGDENYEGLKEWDGLDDVMFLLSDDNFANTRTLPSDEIKDRAAGWGLYYHFDYHGDPISYEWVNSTPITKAWEQLTMAYDNGIKELWVANVGDLRPQELPLSYFLTLAFDYDEWKDINKTGEYLAKWTAQQFAQCDENTRKNIFDILNDYTRLNGDRRPEATHADTFLPGEEAGNEYERALRLEKLTQETEKTIPDECKDAFTGLVSFPALASANLRKMMICAGAYKVLAGKKAASANSLHTLTEDFIRRDKELENVYNNEMAGGKWKYMMSSKHVDFVAWNDEGSDYPRTAPITTADDGEFFLLTGDGLNVPVLDKYGRNSFCVYALTHGTRIDGITAESSDSRISCEIKKLDDTACRIIVTADTDAVNETLEAQVVFALGEKQEKINVKVCAEDISAAEKGAFIESDGVVCMNAERFADKKDVDGVSWQLIDNYGKSGSAIKCLPNRVSFENAEAAPYAEYRFFITEGGEYTVTSVIAPTNNPYSGKGLRYALKLDDAPAQVFDSLPEGYAAGSVNDALWKKCVLDNCRRCDETMSIGKGMHTLRFILIDAGVVLQKIEIAKTPSKAFYGYHESGRK